MMAISNNLTIKIMLFTISPKVNIKIMLIKIKII